MNDEIQNPSENSSEGADAREGVERPVRADARRNMETLLRAAKEVFGSSGVDAPVREIADRAGVGVGTFYRHFPQRSDLVAAVFRNEVDACADAAPILAAEFGPAEALLRWLQRYGEFIVTKRGLATALYSGDSAFDALPAYFQNRLGPALKGLLDSAAQAGEIRGDLRPDDLLQAVANLCLPGYCAESAEHPRRMIALIVDGLRYGARPSTSE